MKNRKGSIPYSFFDYNFMKKFQLKRNNIYHRKGVGFTLIETLMVMGIISLLATTVVTVINPAKKFEDARNKQREIHLETILSAIYQQRITTGSDCPDMPDDIELIEEKEVPVFKIIGTGEEKPNSEEYYNLYSCLVPIYLGEPLWDPAEGDRTDTRYKIWQNPYSKRVTLLYEYEEEGKPPIVAGPKDYWIMEEPTVETKAVESQNIAHYWAEVWGGVIDDGGLPIWERGIIWAIKSDEELTFYTMDGSATSGSGTGDFFANATGLKINTQYSVRAYAKNDKGTGFGKIEDFTTPDPRPTVRTLKASDVVVNQATLWGEVTSLGEVTYADVYFKWSEGDESLNNETEPRDEVGTAKEFFFDLKDLTYNESNPVIYYFQACAQYPAMDERCGDILSFETAAGPPIVGTINYSELGAYSAKGGGVIFHDGGLQVTEYGLCYDPIMTPTTCMNTVEQVGTGFIFYKPMENLTSGATYWYFAYAKNEKGTGKGLTKSFTTTVTAPTISETIIMSDGTNAAELGGFITSDGGASITGHGICWAEYSAEPGFHLPHQCEKFNGGQIGEFTFKMKNFLVGTGYNVKAFAINNKNLEGWGPTENFTPSVVHPPALVTESVDIEGLSTTTVFNGTIKDNGGAEIEDLGFCWGVDKRPERPSPQGGSCVEIISLPEVKVARDEIDFEFSAIVEDLPRRTDYYALVFAKNNAYAQDGLGLPAIKFRTPPGLPAEVETGSVDKIEGQEATVRGEIISTGGDSSTIAGICYAPDPTTPTFPTSGSSKCQILWSGGEVGGFSWTLEELTGGATYNYVAFAQNNHEQTPLVYGDVESFKAGSVQGADCTSNFGCATRFCADNVCCDQACTDDCQSCKEPVRGTCTLAGFGEDPRNNCEEETDLTSCLNICQGGRRADYCGNKTGACYIIPENTAEGYVCIGEGNQTPIETAVKEYGISCEKHNLCEEGACTGLRYYTSCKGDGNCWRAVEDYRQAYKEVRNANPGRSLTKDCEKDGYVKCGYAEGFTVCNGLCSGNKAILFCGGELNGPGNGICELPIGSETRNVKPNYICRDGEEILGTCLDCAWCQASICTNQFYDLRNIPSLIPTKQINDQCWMTQNMNIGTRVDGLSDQNTSCDVNIKKYCYDNDTGNCTSINPTNPDGGLYQWGQAMCGSISEVAQGICPDGWHIPTLSEWQTLINNVSPDPGTKLKPGGSSGFEGNLAGHRNLAGSFAGRLNYAGFWSSTQYYTTGTVWYWSLYVNDPNAYQLLFDKNGGFSVRCIKN